MYIIEANIERSIELFTKEYFANKEIEKMIRNCKYTLGERVKNAIVDMDKSFCIGWRSSDPVNKLRYYEEAAGLLMFIQHKLNEMNDIGVIDDKNKALFDMLTDKIDEQLRSLTNSQRKRTRRQSAGDSDPAGSGLNN